MTIKTNVEIENFLLDRLRGWLSVSDQEIDVNETFSAHGLDSVGVTGILAELSQLLGRRISPTLAWQYPSIRALAGYLTSGATAAAGRLEPSRSSDEPIAVVGMSCRFPKAPNIRAFWQLLASGSDAITQTPKDRWDESVLYGYDSGSPSKRDHRWGGFLEQVDRFDPLFFGISPKEATQLDPQQRLMLELSWEALEDAGIPPLSLKESRTGVYFGVMWPEYAVLLHNSGPQAFTQHTVLGFLHSFIANRVSYVLGLQGPSVALDSACSSALTAIHLACASLRRGETALAVVGGVNLNLLADITMLESRVGALSPDGRSYTFDARANGCVRGEGGGVVVLRPLSQAVLNRDPIYCVIRGSAVNNDGPSNGFSAPNPRAQEAMLREAYAAADIPVAEVDYVELHGTGTQLGDPIEAEALGRALCSDRPAERPLIVGAVKTNIGHLEAAAGIAGFIKTALCLAHREIPPSLNYETRNPHIPAELPLVVQRVLGPWPRSATGRRAVAGVSSFGMGGTNAHVVLEESITRAAPVAAKGPVFVFSGQGSQWLGMGRALLQQAPLFRALLERCDLLIRQHLGWSLLSELAAPEATSRLGHIEVTWPAIVAIEIALAELLRSQGVTPALVIGHSNGEVAAAQIAGVLTLEDAMQVACTQGNVMEQIHGQGAMALVALGWEQAEQAIADYPNRLHRAIKTTHDATVITGEPAAVDSLLATLANKGIFCRRIQVDVAGHGPQILPLEQALRAGLRGIKPQPARVPIVSLATGRASSGEHLDAEYWIRHLSEPVYFADTLSSVIGEGYSQFVEIAPHPIVHHAVEALLKSAGQDGQVLTTMRRGSDDLAAVLDTLAALCATAPQTFQLLPLSTRNPDALSDLARAYHQQLCADENVRPKDIAYTASVRRSHHEYRAAIVGSTKQEWREMLAAFSARESTPGVATGRISPGRPPKVVFVFSGIGSQWAKMGKLLLIEEPVFRAAVVACDAAIRKESGRSIVQEILADEVHLWLDRPEMVQPLLFALQVALVGLLRSWGVSPDALVGHSMGEVAAAHVAGALSLDDAVRIVCRRSRIMKRISGKGAMAVVELSAEQARQVIAPQADSLAVAISNGPRTTVLSGEPQALDSVLAQLEREGVFFRRLQGGNAASHSPQADVLQDELLAALAELSPQVPTIPMYSTVTTKQITDASLDAAYWFGNMRQPVLFWPTIESLARQGHQLFIEVSPHPVLVPALRDGLRQTGTDSIALGTLRREQPERRCLLETLAELYVRGYELNWAALHAGAGFCVPLPAYPWQRERYWVEAASQSLAGGGRALGGRREASEHPLLGQRFSVSTQPGTHFWEQQLSLQRLPMLAEHRIQGQAVFPGTGYLELALAAGRQVYGEARLVLEEVWFERMLTLDEEAPCTIQTALTTEGPQGASFQVASLHQGQWLRHASGKLRHAEAPLAPPPPMESLEALKQRCPSHRGKEELYQEIAGKGGGYGRQFQGIEDLWVGQGELLGRLSMPESVSAQTLPYQLHPAWLDACLHVTLGSARLGRVGLWGPVRVDRIGPVQPLGQDLWVHVMEHATSGDAAAELNYSLQVFGEDGQLALAVQGLKLVRIADRSEGTPDPDNELLYEVQWRAQDLPVGPPSAAAAGPWLLLMDRGGVGRALLERLQHKGDPCVVVEAGDRYQKLAPAAYRLAPGDPQGYAELLRDSLGASGSCKGIIQLWSLDSTPPERTTLDTLEQDQRLGYLSALHLVQAMMQTSWRDSPPVYFLTRGLVSTGQEPTSPSLAQASLWGLGKVIAIEQPSLSCRRIDLDKDQTADQVEALVHELLASSREEEVALRHGKRFVARLVRSRLKPLSPGDAGRIRSDRTYLITGGLRGLGLLAAEWLASAGARHLVLVGRSTASDSARSRIAEMQASGVQVVVAQVDVASLEQLAQLLTSLDQQQPPLGGVIHSAAVLDDGLLESQTAARFQRVMAPKVRGAWNLHLLTQDRPLDFFVCYASVASVLGSPGQANYVAANAFLDAFAHYRQRSGQCATSINWGLFAEEGMATVQDNLDSKWSVRGMQRLPVAEAKQVFLRLLAEPRAQLGVMRLDGRKWVEYYPYLAGAPFWTDLIQDQERAARPQDQEAAPWRTSLLKVAPAERPAILDGLLAKQIGRILRLEAQRIDRHMPLRQLGVDSLMSLEIRNLLELNLGVKLPAVILLTHPTITTLSANLLERLGGPAPASPVPLTDAGVQATDSHRVADKLNQMTEADLLARLKSELALAKKGGKS